jgi:hypothetical protein
MKYDVEMGSGAMIYKRSFIKKCSSAQNLIGGIHTHRQHCDDISLLLFFQNKGSIDVGFEFWPGYYLFSLHQFRLGCDF